MAVLNRKSEAAGALRWQSDMLGSDFASEIAPAWEDLARHSSEKNIFSFPWFIIPSLPLLAEKTPEILTVYDGDLLIGLFIIHADRGYARLPIGFLRTALHPDQFLGTPIVRAGYADKFAEALCEWLDSAPPQVTLLLLMQISADSEISNAIIACCTDQNRNFSEVQRFERAAIGAKAKAVSNVDELLRKSRLKSLRRKLKSLKKEGPVAVEQLSDANDLDGWLADFMRLENSGWKKENGSSILSFAEDESFYRQMVPSAFSRGALNFFRLCVGGKAIAYTLDIVCAPYAYCLKTAYDPEYRKFSPGVIMEYETLKYYAEQEHIEIVDSCTDADNPMLNEIWPDRRSIISLAIGRNSQPQRSLFSFAHFLKKQREYLSQNFPFKMAEQEKSA